MTVRSDGDRTPAARAVGLGAALLAGLLLAWAIADVLLLAFAAVLVAVLIDAPAQALAGRTPLSRGWALALVVLVAAALLAAGVWLFGRELADQLGDLVRNLPHMLDNLRAKLAQFDWLIGAVEPQDVVGAKEALTRGASFVAGAFGAGAALLVVLLGGVFIATQPALYVGGALLLVAPPRRARAREVLGRIGHTLRWWLLGQMVLMGFVGVASYVGLRMLGVEMPLALAVLAGLLEFVPYLGPFLAAVPAVLVALGQSPELALYSALLYAGIQASENLVQPLVQQRMTYLPPALILFSQIALGIVFGVKGLMLATPLTAVLMIAVRTLYVEDFLGDRPA